MAVHPGLISLNKLRIEQSLLVCVSIYIWGLKRKKPTTRTSAKIRAYKIGGARRS